METATQKKKSAPDRHALLSLLMCLHPKAIQTDTHTVHHGSGDVGNDGGHAWLQQFVQSMMRGREKQQQGMVCCLRDAKGRTRGKVPQPAASSLADFLMASNKFCSLSHMSQKRKKDRRSELERGSGRKRSLERVSVTRTANIEHRFA
jgi:hypothetical protein